MPDPSPGATRAHDALEASRQLVARRKGVPMVVSLLGARQAAAPVTSSADARLADLFETCHRELHPGGADDEAALIETLQAVAYDRLLGGERGPHTSSGGTPAALGSGPRAGRRGWRRSRSRRGRGRRADRARPGLRHRHPRRPGPLHAHR
ncbi:hypothetical protein ACFWR9_34600 [Streptomyces sp. NPDC058534]|uniref:hypothetical protein n=1 Tax=Streptomyces sp. NPDC058534 TaxID=3346541 RepID=UPI00364E364B